MPVTQVAQNRLQPLTVGQAKQMTDDELDAYQANGTVPDRFQSQPIDITESGAPKGAYRAPQVPSMNLPPNAENTQSPDITLGGRLVAENLGNTPQEKAQIIAKQYPDLQVGVSGDNVLIKKKTDASWKVLNPSMSPFSKEGAKEFGKDILGHGADIGSAMAQQAASVAGAGAGAMAAGPAGVMPGAAAASGVTAGGLEYLRQKLAQMAGSKTEPSALEAGVTGAIASAVPPVFGTGVAERGLVPEIAAANKGLLTRGWESLSGLRNKIGSAASGLPAEVINGLKGNYDKLKALEKSPHPALDVTQPLIQNTKDTFFKIKNGLGKEIEDAISGLSPDTTFNLDKYKQPFMDEIQKLESMEFQNDETKNLIARLKHEMGSVFGKAPPASAELPQSAMDQLVGHSLKPVPMPEPPAEVNAEGLRSVRNSLNNLSNIGQAGGLNQGRFGPTLSAGDRAVINIADKSRKMAAEDLARAAGITDKNAAYSQLTKDQKILAPFMKDDQSAYKGLTNLFNPANASKLDNIRRLDQQYGLGLEQGAKDVSSLRYFGKPNVYPMAQGASSMMRSVPLAGLGAAGGYALGEKAGPYGGSLGAALGGGLGVLAGSPKAIKSYVGSGRNIGRLVEKLKGLGLPPQSAAQYLFPGMAGSAVNAGAEDLYQKYGGK